MLIVCLYGTVCYPYRSKLCICFGCAFCYSGRTHVLLTLPTYNDGPLYCNCSDVHFLNVWVCMLVFHCNFHDFSFQYPQPPVMWSDILEAKTLSSACIQDLTYKYIEVHREDFNKFDEDCLYMNIYVPKVCSKRILLMLIKLVILVNIRFRYQTSKSIYHHQSPSYWYNNCCLLHENTIN